MTSKSHDLFGPGSNIKNRIFRDYEKLKEQVEACKMLGMRIVLTSGTYDLLHVGHSRYLEKARDCGDLLIVGVDSDEKTRSRKGPHRPIVPESERLEILCHLRHVDLVFLKQVQDEPRQLIRTVRPDVLILTAKNSRKQEEIDDMKTLCGEVIILESQATTSTTAKVRRVLTGPVDDIKKQLLAAAQGACKLLDQMTGGSNE